MGRKNLLILDLDETLIHASEYPLDRDAEFIASHYFVYTRPYLAEFIKECSVYYDLAVWTSSSSFYATQIIHSIFPEPEHLKFAWFKERCTLKYNHEKSSYYFIKNLEKVKRIGYSLDQVLMVDDTPSKLEKNFGNYIQIGEWTGAEDDKELLRLVGYLIDLSEERELRSIEKRNWQQYYQLT